MRLFIAPYKMYSETAKALATSLGVLRVDGSKSFKKSDVIINWGCSPHNVKFIGTSNIINAPNAVDTAIGKLTTLQYLKAANVPTVEWTTDLAIAQQWKALGDTVMARKLTKGSQGKGIEVIIPDDNQWTKAALYTKYIKAHEYRVHVFNKKVIDIQKKKRRTEGEADPFIKNAASGWVFCKDGIAAPLKLYDAAIKSVVALGLDFGAVDILYREVEDMVAVLEINTSPGLEGSTLQSYVTAIKEMLCS